MSSCFMHLYEAGIAQVHSYTAKYVHSYSYYYHNGIACAASYYIARQSQLALGTAAMFLLFVHY